MYVGQPIMYRIAGNFQRCKILQKCLQTLKKKVFVERTHNARTTPLAVDVSVPHANLETRRNSEAKSKSTCLYPRKHAYSQHKDIINLISRYTVCMVEGIIYVCIVYGHVQIHCWVSKPSFCTIHYVECCEFHTVGLNASKTRTRARAG